MFRRCPARFDSSFARSSISDFIAKSAHGSRCCEMKRVVTGHDAKGRSVFTVEDEPKSVVLEKAGGLRLTELWATTDDVLGNAPVRPRRIEPEPGGSVFRMGAKAADKATRRHPGMHGTKTLDYAIVLSG